MARLRYNGLTATLGAALTSSATSVTFGAALTYNGAAATAVPTIAGSDYIPLTILDSSGNVSEIVSLTAYTSGATTGTISRAQEGTTGVAHNSGDKVVHGPTVADVPAAVIAATDGSTVISTTSTTFIDVPGLSVTIPAQVGHRLLITATASVYASNTGKAIDLGVAVAGSLKTANAQVTAAVSAAAPISVQWLHAVAAGDISGGTVAVKAQYKSDTAATSYVLNDGANKRYATLAVVNVG